MKGPSIAGFPQEGNRLNRCGSNGWLTMPEARSGLRRNAGSEWLQTTLFPQRGKAVKNVLRFVIAVGMGGASC